MTRRFLRIKPFYFKHDALIAFSLYFILTLIYFRHILPLIGQVLLGPPGDNMQQSWNIWWFYKSLDYPQYHLSFCPLICYPDGASLLFQSFSFYCLFISFFLRPFLILIAAYNIIMLHSFPLAGLGAFLLIRYLTKDSLAAIIGGFIFAFSPYHFSRALNHMELNTIQFIPFFALYFIKAIRRDKRKDLVLASLFFLLVAVSAWNYLAFTLIFIFLAYVYCAAIKRNILLPVLYKIFIIILPAFFIILPWVYRMLFHSVESFGHDILVIDLLGLFVPHPHHLLGTLPIVKSINNTYTGFSWEAIGYLGVINSLLIIFTWKYLSRRALPFLLGAGVFILLSMGVSLHIAGQGTPVVILPYKIIELTPLLNNARAPSRIIVYAYLFLSVLAAYSFKFLKHRYRLFSMRSPLLWALIALIGLDFYSLRYEATGVQPPFCYNLIKEDKSEFGIMDVPIGWEENEFYVMYQTFHEKPIVQASVSRQVEPCLSKRLDFYNPENLYAQLVSNKVKYVVMHKYFSKSLLFSSIFPSPVFTVFYEDDKNTVYKLFD